MRYISVVIGYKVTKMLKFNKKKSNDKLLNIVLLYIEVGYK